ncbi:MAG: CNNM domain-containing protein, partial [Bacteroidota bacterium]
MDNSINPVLGTLITLLLVLANAFFVAAEFAIVKVRQSQIELKAQAGSRAAKMAQRLITHLDEYLSATQLGITLASLGLGWVGEKIVGQLIVAILDM